MSRPHRQAPSVDAVGARFEDEKRKPCPNRNNPFGHSPECPRCAPVELPREEEQES